jgi:hypothetical protein
MAPMRRARSTIWVLSAVVAVAATEAQAKPGKGSDCSKGAMRKARAAADKAVRGKDYKAAIATLETFRNQCADVELDPVASAWLIGDLAVAYWKAGQYLECRKLMELETFPKSDVAQGGNDKLMSALDYNLEQCSKAFDAEYATLAANPCPLAIDDAVASAALPAALVPKGATAACMALVPGPAAPAAAHAGSDDDDDDDVVCPRLAVVSKGSSGKLVRRPLGAADQSLADPTFCCGLNQVAVGVKDGKALVRIGADTWARECHGGTATSTLDTIFEWKGSALTPVVDASNVVW